MGGTAYKDSGSPFKSWDEFVKHNETLPCFNPVCTKLRHGRGKYCSICAMYSVYFGSPNYRTVKRVQYRNWEDKAMDMIQFNHSNVLVTDFCETLTTIVDHARQGLPVEWGDWFKYLHEILNYEGLFRKRSPEQYLAELAGVYCFYDETGNTYIKTERMWYWTLANIMLRGVKAKVRPRASAGRRMHKFGKAVWGIFAPYFLPVAHSTMRNENLKRIREQKLKEAELLLPEETNE